MQPKQRLNANEKLPATPKVKEKFKKFDGFLSYLSVKCVYGSIQNMRLLYFLILSDSF